MSNKKDGFEGLTLTLKKRKLCVKGEGINGELPSNEYLVFGHFDQMSIGHIDSWLKWAPYHMDPVSLQDEYMDKYNIKAYYPEPEKRQNYETLGLDYTIWNAVDGHYPFIVASVIDVSDRFAKMISENSKNSCDVLVDFVVEVISQKISSLNISNIHVAVFPIIGYSDFLLLFKTDDLKFVLDVIAQLKMKCNDKTPYISNSYTFIGFCNHGIESISGEKSNKIELTIRFALQEGVSVSQFKEELDKTVGSCIQKKYKVLGNSDLMIVTNSNLCDVLPLYFYDQKPGAFHPHHNNFKFIRSMRSEVCIEANEKESSVTSYEIDFENKNVVTYKNEFIKILKQLEEFMKNSRMPARIVYGLEIVMKRYLQLIQSHHCFDMQKILGNAFHHLGKCIEQNIKVIEGLNNDSIPNTRYYAIMPMLKALNLFREKVGDYLADMQRSDSLFLEGRSLSHPSVGSATKLLFFYNSYIDQIKEIIAPDEKDRYSFVVMSGGTDQTQAIDLFSHLDPSDSDIYSVILITIPESSLYDVKSSLFHMLHELLHFCGERNRRDRLNYIIDALCNYTAILFSKFLKEEQSRFIQFNLEQCKSYLTPENWKQLQEAALLAINECTNTLNNKINQEFKKCICKKVDENKEKICLYGRFVYIQLQQLVEEILMEPDKKFEYCLNQMYREYRLELLQILSNVFSGYNIPYSGIHLNIEKLKIENTISPSDMKNLDCHEARLISCIINLYLGKENGYFKETIKLGKEDIEINLKSILYVLKDLFKECYADCMAGKIMNIQQEEFVFSFLSEARNERDAFPMDTINRLRMMINFQYLFSVQKDSVSLISSLMEEEIKRLWERGTCYVEEEKIENWLKQLLNTSGQEKTISAIINPVKCYVECCRKFWENNTDIMKKIQEINDLNNYSGMKDTEDTYKFLNYVMSSWINYAKIQE